MLLTMSWFNINQGVSVVYSLYKHVRMMTLTIAKRRNWVEINARI